MKLQRQLDGKEEALSWITLLKLSSLSSSAQLVGSRLYLLFFMVIVKSSGGNDLSTVLLCESVLCKTTQI